MSDRALAFAGAGFIVFLLAGLLGLYESSLGVILQGAALGLGTGLMAVGLVLIYQTTKVINFAYGAMGTLAGSVATGLTLGTVGLSWFLAIPIGILVGTVIGLLVELVVIRRFSSSPRLVLTVATIGLAQLLGGLAIYVPDWLGTEPLNPGFATPLSDLTWRVSPVTLNGNHLLLAAVVPVIIACLVWFLRASQAGIAVRGMSENLDRARLLGIPVDRLSQVLWALTGALAAITVILRAPTQGLSVDAASGPVLLLAPLAAAVVVGMRSIPGALLVGVAIDIIDQLAQINLDSRTWTYVVLLGIIVVGLLLQERPAARVASVPEQSWSDIGVARAMSPELAAAPAVRITKVVLSLGLAAVVIGLPFVAAPAQTNYATITLVYGLAAISLVVLTGWGGSVSLGQFALVGVGGLTAANLIAEQGLDLFVTILLSGLAAGVVAAAIGVPALRVSGQLLAVTTLAFAVAIQFHVINPANFTDLVPTSYDRPELFGSVALADERWLYFLALALVVASGVVVNNLRRARTGRVIRATRDNDRSAEVVGVSSVRVRISAFIISGMLAGVAGAIHAVTLRGLGANVYAASDSLLLLSMAVIGGVASLAGALSGVALIMGLGYAFPRLQLLLAGVGVLAILMLLPGGLAEAFARGRDRLARLVLRGAAGHRPDDPNEPDASNTPAETTHPTDAPDQSVVGHGGGVEASDALLACHDVESGYGPMQVLFGADLDVRNGEVVALVGTNGAGKSTLLKAVAGLLPVSKGTVRFDGRDIAGLPTELIAELGLALVPGGEGVFPSLTVRENMRLAAWMLRHDQTALADRRCEMLALFPILQERWEQQAGDLSGGEQQQLSLAMAFLTDPKVVLIDELSLGLAPTVVTELVAMVKELQSTGTAIVVVEQSVDVALTMAHDAVFLEKGEVRFRGATAELLERPDLLRSVFIGGGHEAAAPVPEDEPPNGRPARSLPLECRSLSKRFGGISALDAVDLVVPAGRITGLIGHNGAGKTTLFDAVSGFIDIDGGRVLLDGDDITGLAPHERAVLQLGRSFQEALLYPSLTVVETVTVALETHLANRDPVAAALRLPASSDSEGAAAQRAGEVIDLLGLDAYRDRLTGELSTGTRRIVELACLLAHDPTVILLDEPTAGMAQAETSALVPLLRRIQGETSCSMMVIEHDMTLVSELCDELVAMEQGRIIAQGQAAEVLSDPLVVQSYLGTKGAVVGGGSE